MADLLEFNGQVKLPRLSDLFVWVFFPRFFDGLDLNCRGQER